VRIYPNESNKINQLDLLAFGFSHWCCKLRNVYKEVQAEKTGKKGKKHKNAKPIKTNLWSLRSSWRRQQRGAT
jgi:hypothetical protein